LDPGRNAPLDEKIRQGIDDIGGVELALHSDGQAFPAVFINDVECPEGPAVIGPVMDKVIRPDMVPALGFEANARAVVQP